jgi:membrane protease YdiL (CAAX protease family)
MKKKISTNTGLKTSLLYFLYLFTVWTAYRMSFKFSDNIEELYIKPVIWLLPFLYIFPKDHIRLADIGITTRNFFRSIYLSIALGVGFAFLGLIANIAKYGTINFEANIGSHLLGISILISFVTSITEELVFRGYLLGVFMRKYKGIIPVIINSLLWTAMHAPISYYFWHMDGVQTAVYLSLTFIYGLGASLLYGGTKNIAAPIMLHVLWEWPIILFR